MQITGTLIKNFFHCKRQAYLYYHGLNFRSELTRIGELMHEEQHGSEFLFDNIKIDHIKDNAVIEYKKTSSNIEGTRFQLLFYLSLLNKKGLDYKGKIIDLTYGDTYDILLDDDLRRQLSSILKSIKDTMQNNEYPPRLQKKKSCRKCSFIDYCWAE